jgi:protein-S-isoprenylcysteine O-methyltransferase Ste14
MDALRVPLKPPVLFFIALLTGAGLGHVRPWGLLAVAFQVRLGIGCALFLSAVSLGGWGLWTLRRFKTSPEFGQPVTTIVQEGPYRFSRNPLYLALVLVLVGFAFALDNAWLALEVPLLGLALDRLVIAREEPFLQEIFGAEYEAYRARVRRWL